VAAVKAKPLLVVAIGGNALLHRGEAPTIEAQRANVKDAAAVLAGLAAGHRLVITHATATARRLACLLAKRRQWPGWAQCRSMCSRPRAKA